MVTGLVFTGLWPVLPPWPLALPLAALALCPRGRASPVTGLLRGLACGCVLGVLYGTALLHRRVPAACVGQPVVVTGRVSSLPGDSLMPGDRRRQRFEFSVSDLSPARCRGPSRLLLSYYGDDTIVPGDRWRFEAALRKPWGQANPGGFNSQAWFAQQGIDGVGTIRSSGTTRRLPARAGTGAIHHRVRQAVSGRIGELGLDRDVAAMLRALTVADRSGIRPQLWRLLQRFGINHLLVISGLHVGLVAGAGYLLGGLCLRLLPGLGAGGAWLPGMLAFVPACLYGALAGFSLPTQRALCMLACVVAAGLTGRAHAAVNSLLLAATAVLVINPLAALGSGFWLSFGAVAALLWLARWQRGLGPLVRLLRTHGFMSLVMLPLGAGFFGGGSLVAMLANLLMIPLVGMVIVPLALVAVLGYCCGWPPDAGFWQLAAWPLRQLLPLATALSGPGDPWWYIDLTGALPAVLPAAVAVALLVLPAGHTLKLLAAVLLLPLVLPPAAAVQPPSLDTNVTVLDVGQGTAVVVRSGSRALLYDTGGGDPRGQNMATAAVIPYLRLQGVTGLDTLVISHPDLDHSAGTATVLNAMAVARFRHGGADPGTGEGRRCLAGESWRWPGGQVFQFLSPAVESPPGTNNISCVLQVRVGKQRLLLTGDIEKAREHAVVRYWGDSLESDWLLVAHHGSRTSTSPTFLKRVLPRNVVISSGYANRFGHPHPGVIERLRRQGAKIFSTATDGALEFEFDEEGKIHVSAYRQVMRRYWM